MALLGFDDNLYKALTSPTRLTPGGGLTANGSSNPSGLSALFATAASSGGKGDTGAQTERFSGSPFGGPDTSDQDKWYGDEFDWWDLTGGWNDPYPGGWGATGFELDPEPTTYGGGQGTTPPGTGSTGLPPVNNPFSGFFQDPKNILGVVNLGLSAIGTYLNMKEEEAAKEAVKQQREDLLDEVARVTSPAHFIGVFRSLLPSFRASVAAQSGSQVEGAVANSLARRGMVGTGVGTALTGAAAGSTEAVAVQEAMAAAEGVVNSELAGLGLNAQTFLDESVFTSGLGDLIITTGSLLSQLLSAGLTAAGGGGGGATSGGNVASGGYNPNDPNAWQGEVPPFRPLVPGGGN